jgi:glycerophosphoryl diester phosphodiesterase
MQRFLRWAALAIVLIASLLVGLLWIARPAPEHPYYAKRGFGIIAHRGGRGLGPENTLETFRASIRAGVNVLEMDLRRTTDGQLVVLHDADVARTTNGRGPVSQMRLAQLKQLDAGFHWTADNGRTYPYRGRQIRVPTLAEVLQGVSGARLVLEIKEDDPGVCAPLCRLLETSGREEEVIIASTHDKILKHFRAVCGRVATSAGPNEATIFYLLSRLHLEGIYSPAMQSLQIPPFFRGRRLATGAFVRAAHGRRLRVEVWTVDDPAAMRSLINLGVDGIMTDYPDRLKALLSSHPPPTRPGPQ